MSFEILLNELEVDFLPYKNEGLETLSLNNATKFEFNRVDNDDTVTLFVVNKFYELPYLAVDGSKNKDEKLEKKSPTRKGILKKKVLFPTKNKSKREIEHEGKVDYLYKKKEEALKVISNIKKKLKEKSEEAEKYKNLLENLRKRGLKVIVSDLSDLSYTESELNGIYNIVMEDYDNLIIELNGKREEVIYLTDEIKKEAKKFYEEFVAVKEDIKEENVLKFNENILARNTHETGKVPY